MSSGLSREILTPLWASVCQTCDVPVETKQPTSSDDQGVETEVFSEEDTRLAIQSARKVIFQGHGWEEHATPPHSFSRTALWLNIRKKEDTIARAESHTKV